MELTISAEVQSALIGAVASAIITPLVQIFLDQRKCNSDYRARVSPIIAHIRILHDELLQFPINPSIEGVGERILAIEQFHDPIFNDAQNHFIKLTFLNEAKFLDKRHKHSRPWMEIEYPQAQQTFGNAAERFLALLDKKPIPELFDPSE